MTDMQAITSRMDRLEKQNRWLKRVMCVIVAGLGVTLLMAQAAPKARVIEAERFVLKDGNGKTRGQWYVRDNGKTVFCQYSKRGKVRNAMIIEPDNSPRMYIYDKNEKVRAYLGEDYSGSPSLGLIDENETLRASLGRIELLKAGSEVGDQLPLSSLVLFDEQGKAVFQAP